MYDWNYFEESPCHPIADADNLYDGYRASRRGSQWKAQVQRFRWNCMREIRKLQLELTRLYEGLPGGYELSPYSRFEVMERGRARAITALCMRDRVVKHVLNDLYLIPHTLPHLIYDNGASLKGRGTSFTRRRLQAHLERYYRETGSNEGYIMTMDFSAYYDNIDHRLAMQMIRKYEPDSFARQLVKQAFDSFRIDLSELSEEEFEKAKREKFSLMEYRKKPHSCKGEKLLEKSVSVGDQTSQITAVAYATPIDRLVKTVCGCRYYGRYMDDLYVISGSLEELRSIREKIERMAERLKLIVNRRKTKIGKLRSTFTFMQHKYFLAANGHVVVRISPRTITRMRRRLHRLARRRRKQARAEEMFRSWIANHGPLMSGAQRKRIIAQYQKLFGGGLDTWMRKRRLLCT